MKQGLFCMLNIILEIRLNVEKNSFSKSGSFIRPKIKQKRIQIKSHLDSTISIMCELDHGPTWRKKLICQWYVLFLNFNVTGSIEAENLNVKKLALEADY